MGSSPSVDQIVGQNSQQLTYQSCTFHSFMKQNITILSDQNLTSTQINTIQETLKKQFFAVNVSNDLISQLAQKFKKGVCNINDGWLFKQGSYANYLFILARGRVDVVKQNYFVRTIETGEIFGQLALLYGIKRSSSIKFQKDNKNTNEYFILQKSHFLEYIEKISQTINESIQSVFEDYLPFQYLTYSKQKLLTKSAFKISFPKNKRIFTKFDEPYGLFFILTGTVKIIFPNRDPIILKTKNCFGYYGSNRSDFSATVAQDCTFISLGREPMHNILEQDIIYLYLQNRLKNILLWNKHLKQVSYERICKIVNRFRFCKVQKTKLICQVNQLITRLLIPIDCLSQQNTQLIYGLQQILKNKRYFERDLVSNKQGYYACISIEQFQHLIQISEFGKIFNKIGQIVKPFDIRYCRQLKCLKYNELGQASKILYEQPKFGQYFIFSKYNYDIPGEQDSYDKAIKIMKTINSLFFQGFYYSLKNFQFGTIYSQYIPSIALDELFYKIGPFSSNHAKFYFSIFVVIFQKLHSLQVISRNWSLSDYRMDHQGFLLLSNFTKSKFLRDNDNYKTHKTQTINTIPYQCCPQMIKGQMYGLQADFWGLGLLLYFLLFGDYPFGRDKTDPMQIYSSILQQELNFCFYLKSKQMNELLHILLNRKKQMREKLNFSIIKNTGLLKNTDWASLEKKKIPSIYIPTFDDQIIEF